MTTGVSPRETPIFADTVCPETIPAFCLFYFLSYTLRGRRFILFSYKMLSSTASTCLLVIILPPLSPLACLILLVCIEHVVRIASALSCRIQGARSLGAQSGFYLFFFSFFILFSLILYYLFISVATVDSLAVLDFSVNILWRRPMQPIRSFHTREMDFWTESFPVRTASSNRYNLVYLS